MGNHWSDSGDLVIEEKTLFRRVGWLGHTTGRLTKAEPNDEGRSPLYEQISTWVEGEGWKD